MCSYKFTNWITNSVYLDQMGSDLDLQFSKVMPILVQQAFTRTHNLFYRRKKKGPLNYLRYYGDMMTVDLLREWHCQTQFGLIRVYMMPFLKEKLDVNFQNHRKKIKQRSHLWFHWGHLHVGECPSTYPSCPFQPPLCPFTEADVSGKNAH